MRLSLGRSLALGLACVALGDATASASPGALTVQGCLAQHHAEDCSDATALTGAHGVAVSPDGASVYTVGRSPGAVASFSRDPVTGAVTETGCTAEGGADGCASGPAALAGVAGIVVS